MSDRPLHTLRLQSSILSRLDGAGYETVGDITNLTPESLSQAVNISLTASQEVFSATRLSSALPMTQSAAAMMTSVQRYPTGIPPLDRLLDGGLKRGSILEINGPPGCGKEQLAVNAIKSFVEAKHRVLFVDMQNMVPPATIKRTLSGDPTAHPDGLDLVHYQTIHTPLEFVVFLRNLPGYIEAQPSTFADFKGRAALQEKLKETLARMCSSKSLTVIITSQLYTELRIPTGEPGLAPKGSSIMRPHFDCKANGCCNNDSKSNIHAHFPNERTYRVLIVPQLKTSGVIRLLLSPGKAHVQGNTSVREEAYQRIGGTIQ